MCHPTAKFNLSSLHHLSFSFPCPAFCLPIPFFSLQKESFLVDNRNSEAIDWAAAAVNVLDRITRHFDADTKDLDATTRAAFYMLLLRINAILQEKAYIFGEQRIGRRLTPVVAYFKKHPEVFDHPTEDSPEGSESKKGAGNGQASRSGSGKAGAAASSSAAAKVAVVPPPPPSGPPPASAGTRPVDVSVLRLVRDMSVIVHYHFQAHQHWKAALLNDVQVPRVVTDVLNEHRALMHDLDVCVSESHFGSCIQRLLRTLDCCETLLPLSMLSNEVADILAELGSSSTPGPAITPPPSVMSNTSLSSAPGSGSNTNAGAVHGSGSSTTAPAPSRTELVSPGSSGANTAIRKRI